MKILSVDPGEKRLGIAVSDPTGTIANPLTVIQHVSRLLDAASIAELSRQQQVGLIVVGQALDADDQPTPQGRRAGRLAEAIRSQTGVPVVLWDESGSTQAARSAQLAMGASRKKLRGHFDDLAATYVLQSYLDSRGKP
jgi:putative holliday junction resolvase